MHICVHGVWRWQWWQIQDNRTRSRAEDTVQNGQKLMCVFTLCPTDLSQASPELQRLSLACGGAQLVPHGKSWGQAKPSIGFEVGQELGLRWDRNWVWGGTGLSAAPKHTKETGDSTSTRSDSAPENIHSVCLCRSDQKAKTKPEGRHGWEEKRAYLYFKQVLNPSS